MLQLTHSIILLQFPVYCIYLRIECNLQVVFFYSIFSFMWKSFVLFLLAIVLSARLHFNSDYPLVYSNSFYQHVKALTEVRLWCLTPLSTIFHLYRDGQFYWWRKPEYHRSAASHRQTLSHNVVSSTFDMKFFNTHIKLHSVHITFI